MAKPQNRTDKHFQVDPIKLKRAQKALRTKTETETLELALDLAIAEHRKNRLVIAANERFVKSGIEIRDVYGNLSQTDRTNQGPTLCITCLAMFLPI